MESSGAWARLMREVLKRLPQRRSGKTRRTEKRLEIHQRLIIRTASGSLPALCEACSAGDAIMLSPEHASAMTAIPERLIYQWVEARAIHFREAPNGRIIVCVKTLLLAGKTSKE